jgi:protein phosphatase 1G
MLQLTKAYIFDRMDELLRDPANLEELKSYRPVTEGGEATAPNARALTMLQGSIQTDLQEIREKKGQVTRDEATQVMMKMMFLRRLEQQIGAAATSSDPTAPSSSNAETNFADSIGCTAVSVLVTPSQLIVANAGDSRAILCRRGQAVALSEDHKPNDPRERERIEKAGGTVEETQGGARTHYRVNGNLNLSRAIGDLEYKKNSGLKPDEQMITSTPDVVVIDRTEEDEFITICCDGVYDVMSNDDLVAFINERLIAGKPLNEICEEIADECLSPDPKATQGLGADNITCMIVDLRKRNS